MDSLTWRHDKKLLIEPMAPSVMEVCGESGLSAFVSVALDGGDMFVHLLLLQCVTLEFWKR